VKLVNDHIIGLIIKHLRQTINGDETQTLEKWIAADEWNRKRFEQLMNNYALQQELFANAESDRRIEEQVYARLASDDTIKSI
jgi:hypothetical protein